MCQCAWTLLAVISAWLLRILHDSGLGSTSIKRIQLFCLDPKQCFNQIATIKNLIRAVAVAAFDARVRRSCLHQPKSFTNRIFLIGERIARQSAHNILSDIQKSGLDLSLSLSRSVASFAHICRPIVINYWWFFFAIVLYRFDAMRTKSVRTQVDIALI